jgi:hypothetical protein
MAGGEAFTWSVSIPGVGQDGCDGSTCSITLEDQGTLDTSTTGVDGPGFLDDGIGSGGGIDRSPLSAKDQKKFDKSLVKAVSDLNNPDCQKFLHDHGIDPSNLQLMIQNQLPWDGTKSNISLYNAGTYDMLDPFNQTPAATDFFKKTPVKTYLANHSNVGALSESPGLSSYYRPSNISPQNIIHEGLHNLMGIGDDYLAQALGLPPGERFSQNINPLLHSHHCF